MNTNIDINRKDRSDDVLGNLPPADKKKVIFWLSRHSFEEVVRRIGAPRPEGLGIQTHYTSVRRFYAKNIPDELRQCRIEMIAHLRDLATLVQEEPAPYTIIAREQIEKHLLDLSLDIHSNSEALQRTLDMLLALRSQDLKEKYYQLHRDRLDFQREKGPAQNGNIQLIAAMQGQVKALLTQSVSDQTAADLRQAASVPEPEPVPLPKEGSE